MYFSVAFRRAERSTVPVEFHQDDLPRADPPPSYPGRTIPDSTISALRELFLRMIRTEMMHADDAPYASDLLDPIALLCIDARRHDVRAEQLVIAIKRGWASLHQERQRPRAAGPDDLLNHVITLCIDVYYEIDEPR